MTAAPLAAPRRGNTRMARPATTPLNSSRPGERAAEMARLPARGEVPCAGRRGRLPGGVRFSQSSCGREYSSRSRHRDDRTDWRGSRLTNARSQSQTVAKRRRARRDELAIERLVEWIGFVARAMRSSNVVTCGAKRGRWINGTDVSIHQRGETCPRAHGEAASRAGTRSGTPILMPSVRTEEVRNLGGAPGAASG